MLMGCHDLSQSPNLVRLPHLPCGWPHHSEHASLSVSPLARLVPAGQSVQLLAAGSKYLPLPAVGSTMCEVRGGATSGRGTQCRLPSSRTEQRKPTAFDVDVGDGAVGIARVGGFTGAATGVGVGAARAVGGSHFIRTGPEGHRRCRRAQVRVALVGGARRLGGAAGAVVALRAACMGVAANGAGELGVCVPGSWSTANGPPRQHQQVAIEPNRAHQGWQYSLATAKEPSGQTVSSVVPATLPPSTVATLAHVTTGVVCAQGWGIRVGII